MLPQAQYIENSVSSFQDALTSILARARGDVATMLADRLTLVDGKVSKTKTNTRILQQVDAYFHRAMNRAGYQQAVRQFVMKFPGQLPYFQETLDMLGKQIGRDLKVDFTKRDRAHFIQTQVGAVRLIDSAVNAGAAAAERQAMLSVGGLKLGQLIDAIVVKLDSTVPQAMTLADTAMSTYYRTIAARGFKIIERDMPDTVELRFKYGGPNDKLTRPICRLWLKQTADGKTWTSAEIDKLSNGQLPNVMLTCGGYNCRHQWLVTGLTQAGHSV